MSFPYTVYLSPEQVLQETSVQRLPLGTRGIDEEGRSFRYTQNGATALVANRIVVAAAESPWSTATDVVFSSVYAAGATQVNIGGEATAALGLGTAVDDFKDGWLVVNSTDITYNQSVRIKSHAALASSTALGSANKLNLYPPGLPKLTATSTGLVKLVANPYKKVIVFAGAAQVVGKGDARGQGVPLFAVTASYYFWLQTWGPCLVRAGGSGGSVPADRAGQNAYLSTGDTGSYGAHSTWAITDTATAEYQSFVPKVGVIMTAAPAATFYSMVDLQFAP